MHRVRVGQAYVNSGDALQTRLTPLRNTNRSWGGTIAKLTSCAGVNTNLVGREWVLGNIIESDRVRTSPASVSARTSGAESQKTYIQDQLGSNEVRTALRVSATPEEPLPSMRDIDVKNQPTTTVEHGISFRGTARRQDSGVLGD